MYKKLLAASIVLLSCVVSQAKLRLPQLISDGMVIQQNSDVRLWGWDEPNTKITVSPSWTSDKKECTSDKNGKWETVVRSPRASYTPLSITFEGKGEITVRGILSGEVWVCAGQSNMEMPIEGYNDCPVENYDNWVLDAANSSGIHSIKIPYNMRMTPQDDALPCYWKQCSMENVGKFSAIGYFFARLLNRTLHIPVGLIEAYRGGSRVESWLDRENLEKNTSETLDSAAFVKQFRNDYKRPMVWWNGVIHPILNYTIKGILFYQGCSNVGAPGNQYSDRLALLANQWRKGFRANDIPFYIVEIAPYYYHDVNGVDGALLREQQYRASQIIPNSRLVCTNDCVYPYEARQIHPCQKQKVGERLGMAALNGQYGIKQLICESPTFRSMRISHDSIYVQLDNLANGINRYDDIYGFEVAGSDKVFHQATAVYDKHKGLIITCGLVKAPVALRYCFRNFQLGNVANMAGLPLIPFRTDNW